MQPSEEASITTDPKQSKLEVVAMKEAILDFSCYRFLSCIVVIVENKDETIAMEHYYW